jgi:hypothetical protein
MTRAVRAVTRAGVPVMGVEVRPDGVFLVLTSELLRREPAPAAANDDLDRELAEFEARHGQG